MCRLLRNLRPDFNVELTALPLQELRSRGIKVLAFDLDNTLALARTRQLSEETIAYLKQVRALGFKLFLASNAMIDITHLGNLVGAPTVPATTWSRKPMKSYFRRLIQAADCEPSEIAMIGDRIFTDIYGAKRCGLIAVKIGRKQY